MRARERIPIVGRGAWLDLRKRDVTASEVAALFDAHPFRTHLQVYLSKTGQDGNRGDNPAMRRGRIMESAVAAAVAEEHPEWADAIRKAGDYWRLPDLRLGSTPDYHIGDPDEAASGVLECKTMAPEEFEKWGDAPPFAYTLQTLAQMMTTGAAWGCIAVLVMNRALDLHTFPVPRHAAAEAKIADAVRAFWCRVERGEAPPPTMPADRVTLAGMFKQDNGAEIDLTGDNELPGILAERATLKAAMKRLAEIDDAIKAKVGAARTALASGWRIQFSTQHRKEYTVPAQDVRVLRITRKGEEA